MPTKPWHYNPKDFKKVVKARKEREREARRFAELCKRSNKEM